MGESLPEEDSALDNEVCITRLIDGPPTAVFAVPLENT